MSKKNYDCPECKEKSPRQECPETCCEQKYAPPYKKECKEDGCSCSQDPCSCCPEDAQSCDPKY